MFPAYSKCPHNALSMLNTYLISIQKRSITTQTQNKQVNRFNNEKKFPPSLNGALTSAQLTWLSNCTRRQWNLDSRMSKPVVPLAEKDELKLEDDGGEESGLVAIDELPEGNRFEVDTEEV
ncbi:unnamed protein product [Rodentolepis nana]|uniref:Uncharacterized protein n=1 Tax=Rodentolepis nana TaxID=102285 RepID=A0A0R3U007_RODNA|nr:unnamed protein product [Rodentolepis nana]